MDKKRGSRPRCVLLGDGPRHAVAARFTDLVGLPDVVVSPNHFWMPYGKPVKRGERWDDTPADEARIDRDDRFVARAVQKQLPVWWLEHVTKANTPNWDVASTCNIEGKQGLLLVEAKAHRTELSADGKQLKPNASRKSRENHERIGMAINEANAGLGHATGVSWGLSRDDRYQLANRFAWSWKLAMLGVPVVLIYLGFLNAQEMEEDGDLFRSEGGWVRTLNGHAQGVVGDSCWETRIRINGTPFWPLMRTIDLPFTPTV